LASHLERPNGGINSGDPRLILGESGRVRSAIELALEVSQSAVQYIAMLTALNRPAQLRNHVEGALNNGCTPEELREILLHTAVYCGLPAATDAFRVAEEVLKARKLLE
jgi:alkylhydroperoxidase/carboxymuconolactone decarboxylase family protein YurZ